MALPLPYVVQDEATQGNFDALKQEFPLGRRHMAIEQPHVVGDPGEPAFQNGWVNWDATLFSATRFWKDPMGMVHVEGLVKSGTILTTVFQLPPGYRPLVSIPPRPATSNSVHGEVRVSAAGDVVAQTGSNVYFSFEINFRQEQ